MRACVCACVRAGVGHCPQDEAPELVNPLIEKFVAGYRGGSGSKAAAAAAATAPA